MYYTEDFIDRLEKKVVIKPEESYIRTQACNVAKMLCANKRNYKLFGVYWWSIKEALREYVHDKAWYCGSADDLLMKERARHRSLYRSMLAGMYYMNEQISRTSDHVWHDSDGEEHTYTLYDENAEV
jgi:hypothetical protein